MKQYLIGFSALAIVFSASTSLAAFPLNLECLGKRTKYTVSGLVAAQPGQKLMAFVGTLNFAAQIGGKIVAGQSEIRGSFLVEDKILTVMPKEIQIQGERYAFALNSENLNKGMFVLLKGDPQKPSAHVMEENLVCRAR